MSDLPDAATVLNERIVYWAEENGHPYGMDEARFIIEDLLAHGGPSGVTIRPDGTLVPAGLTEGERELVTTFRAHFPPIDPDSPVSFDRHVVDTLLALIESRLAPPEVQP